MDFDLGWAAGTEAELYLGELTDMATKLIEGQTWYPHKGNASPCEIVRVGAALIMYNYQGYIHPRKCSPSTFFSWIRRWDAKI